MRLCLFISAVLILSGCDFFQKKPKLPDDRTLTFAFYNVENLFDATDDPGLQDQEYLPGSIKNWSDKRYRKKISDLARVIKELGGKELPEIVGLCEVENQRVLKDLVSDPNLVPGRFAIIHFEDRDPRGIDLALIYRPEEFTPVTKRLVPVKRRSGGSYSRGILYVTGKSNNGEVFHIFVNHWPSREKDESSKEEGRMEMAAALRRLTDALPDRGHSSNIVILGDLNDEPDNTSLSKVLGAVPPGKPSPSGLVNLMYPPFDKGYGTVKFQRDWKMLDHVIVSEALLDGVGYRVEGSKGVVYSAYWMEFHMNNGEVSPDRTYLGEKYTGGPGDHFPVYCRMIRH